MIEIVQAFDRAPIAALETDGASTLVFGAIFSGSQILAEAIRILTLQ